MSSRSKDIIFLLGAGASAEAGIPTSSAMIEAIERLLRERLEWKPYFDLYNHVKSAIYYAAGLKGRFNCDVVYNIETLVNTLYELERNEEHPLYPFIASWNSRLVALAKQDFEAVRRFRGLILRELKKWMCPDDQEKADYYRGLIKLQRDLNYPLRVFSLNYDLCIENLSCDNFQIESGFGGVGPSHLWDWERFEEAEANANPVPQVYLYKLHGSINWKREESTKRLFNVIQVESVKPEEMEVIFGRDFKMEAADPYLFFAYEFRKFALETKVIVVIGYGFADTHINKMITQSVQSDKNRRIIVVARCDTNELEKRRCAIGQMLELKEEQYMQIEICSGAASDFLGRDKLAEELVKKIPAVEDAPF